MAGVTAALTGAAVTTGAAPAQAAAPTCDSSAYIPGTHVYDWDIVVRAWYRMPAKHFRNYDEYDWHCTLRYGNTGNGVKALQRSLNECSLSIIGTRLAIDGVFGSRTKAAVIAMQRYHRITVDGIYGPQTAATIWHPYTVQGSDWPFCGRYRR